MFGRLLATIVWTVNILFDQMAAFPRFDSSAPAIQQPVVHSGLCGVYGVHYTSALRASCLSCRPSNASGLSHWSPGLAQPPAIAFSMFRHWRPFRVDSVGGAKSGRDPLDFDTHRALALGPGVWCWQTDRCLHEDFRRTANPDEKKAAAGRIGATSTATVLPFS